MAVNTREVKRRIKSVKNIGQITKAMELVAAAKMRKAQSQAMASRPYATLSAELLRNVAGKAELLDHPLIVRPEKKTSGAKKALVIFITADRGLAGSLNSNAINKAISLIKENQDKEFEFITIGKKGTDAIRRMGKKIIATFPLKEKGLSVMDAKPIVEIATAEFLNYAFDEVFVVYTNFVSTLVQRASALRLLPFETSTVIESSDEFVFEPKAEAVLDRLIKRVIEFAVYQCLVESIASEHSARMVAMKNANKASKDLIEELTLTANQARQAGITRELAEISAAKLAMEG
jgi:F-type H+-transporting ATPase subunit gamma